LPLLPSPSLSLFSILPVVAVSWLSSLMAGKGILSSQQYVIEQNSLLFEGNVRRERTPVLFVLLRWRRVSQRRGRDTRRKNERNSQIEGDKKNIQNNAEDQEREENQLRFGSKQYNKVYRHFSHDLVSFFWNRYLVLFSHFLPLLALNFFLPCILRRRWAYNSIHQLRPW
jgi:hypothetical protein